MTETPGAEPPTPRGDTAGIPSATPEELRDLFEHFNRLTESLRHSHEELEQQVERLQLELADKKSELERKKRLEALGRIAAAVAHEIRNPLGSVVLYLDLLREEVADLPRAEELAKKIRRGVDLVASIVQDVLTFARPDSLRPEPCEPISAVREAAALVEAEARGHGVTLVVEGAPGGTIHADREKLRQILINLLRNAIEATPRGEVVTARVDAGDPGIRIGIRDRGPGIAPEDLEKVFLPFWSGKEKGTGMGLAIVHTLVENHGGTIRLRNASGGGVVAELALPAEPLSTQADPVPCEASGGGSIDP